MTHEPNDEKRLIQRALAADEGALAELFQRHRTRPKRMVKPRMDRRLQGRVDASDILQQASDNFTTQKLPL